MTKYKSTLKKKTFWDKYERSPQVNFWPRKAVYSTIENFHGQLYVMTRVDEGNDTSRLYISTMDPQTLLVSHKQVLWERDSSRWVYFGVIDSCVWRERIWIVFTTAKEWGQLSCQDIYLMWYDPETEEKGDPIRLLIDEEKGDGAGCGNLTVWKEMLWISYNRGTKFGTDSHLCVRSYDGHVFGYEFKAVEHASVYHPAGGILGDRFYIVYEQQGTPAILRMVEFDGESFGESRNIFDIGHNRYVHMTDYDGRLWLFWKCSAPYYKEHGYDYHDIAMMTMDEHGKFSDMAYLVDDKTYNSGPIPTVLDDKIYIVFSKYTKAYSTPGDSEQLGDWAMVISRK